MSDSNKKRGRPKKNKVDISIKPYKWGTKKRKSTLRKLLGQELGKKIVYTDRKKCPNKRNHTKCPESYLGWHSWAREKIKTHKQIRCEGCSHYSIWIPRK